MKIIDEGKVSEIIAELRDKKVMLKAMRDNRHQRRGNTSSSLQLDIDDISHLITSLEQLADAPGDTWTLEVGEE